ncbi:methyltransferase family protein [Klebsiella pneumoniae]|uniref:methyltransferase family protein n=1 Tax=Klebsiella pneumoniae TaxID=573 RepID=UPI001D0202DB|nr:methyltransferase [Klebsiella pneumoniae]
MHIDEVFTISWRVCTALVTGGISLVLSLTGLVTLISNQTTLNALHPERTSMLVTRGCFRFSRNPVYLGFIGLHIALALLLSSVIGLMTTVWPTMGRILQQYTSLVLSGIVICGH